MSELWGASKALFLFGLRRELERPVIVITATEDTAEALVDDLNFFQQKTPHAGAEGSAPEIQLFPTWGVLPFEADSPDSRTVGERMRFLYSLISGNPGIYVVPVLSMMQKLPPWELFADSVKTITTATQIDPDRLVASLVATGYESSSLVTRVGEFSRRGGIVDFFSPLHEQPVRIEFFGDTMESLRSFDPETQRSTGEIREAVVLPVRELIVNDKGIEQFSSTIDNEALIDQVREGTLPPGVEFLAPFFYTMESLFRYLPENSLIASIEPDDVKREVETQSAKIEEGRGEEVAEGRSLPEAPELYLDQAGLDQELARFPLVASRLLGTGAEGFRMDTKSSSWLSVRLTKPINREEQETKHRPVEGTMAGLVEKLRRLRDFNSVMIVCGTDESTARIKKLFMEYGLGVAPATHLVTQDKGPWPVVVTVGRLSEGFAWQELGLIFITEEEIFGRKVHRPSTARAKAAPFLSTFKELKPGDFVVHTDYGVGEYQGLTHIDVDGFETDFLSLRYEPDAKLYVPLYSLDKVQKYIGTEGIAPKLDRLGSRRLGPGPRKKSKDILEMAQELVAVYAGARGPKPHVLYSARQSLPRV